MITPKTYTSRTCINDTVFEENLESDEIDIELVDDDDEGNVKNDGNANPAVAVNDDAVPMECDCQSRILNFTKEVLEAVVIVQNKFLQVNNSSNSQENNDSI